jgi:hypothetical protein
MTQTKISIAIITYFLFSFVTLAQQIKFEPKQLKRDIVKLSDCTNYTLVELNQYNKNSHGKYFSLACNQQAYVVYVGRVLSCRTGGCSSSNKIEEKGHEYFDYYMLVNSNKAVVSLRVYNYVASYGHQITAQSWLKQFYGFNGNKKLEIGKNIDGISGATISVRNLVNDINHQLSLIKEFDNFVYNTY